MDLRNAPVLLPAAALAAGAFVAFDLAYLPVPLLILLAALGIAWGRRAGACLACAAAGALAAVLAHGLPVRPEERLDPERPVAVTATVAGHWIADGPADGVAGPADEEGWSAPVEVSVLAQGGRIETPRLTAILHLPGAEEPPPFGSRLRVQGYLHRSPGFANRAATPPGPWRIHVKSRLLLAVEAGPGPVARLSGALRRRVETACSAAGPESPGRGLAWALVLGDASRLPLAWRRGLRITGLSHLLSVSGLHVAMAAGLALLAGGFLGRRARWLLAAAAIALYLLLAGPLPALVRAAVMGLLACAALLAERPPAAANGLGWAVVLLVLERPEAVREPVFQLSASATAGLVLLAPALVARWPRLPPRLARTLAMSVAAELCALPWSLPLFHSVAPAAPLANLLAVPWTGLALAAALAWTALALASPELAAAAAPALDLFAAPFSWPAATGPGPWLGLPLLASPATAWLLAAGLAVALTARPRRALVLAPPLLALALRGLAPRPHGLELAMLDVGQGDAILLRDGPRAVLVDGGGWRTGDLGGRVLLPALLAEGVRRLDAVVLTHPDRDHCGGLVDIAAYLPVAEVWTGPGWDPAGCAGDLLVLPGTRPRVLWAGETARAGRWRFAVLHPEPGERREENERSLVLRAEAPAFRLLLTGDVEHWAEHRLLALPAGELAADVLKVAHHGSRTSSGEDFLDAVRPRLALISAGRRNLYHHPSETVLDRLAARHVPVLRTDRDGMIHLEIGAGGRLRITLPGAPK